MTKRPISSRGATGSPKRKTDNGMQKPCYETAILTPSCLSLDLEVGKKNNRIHAFAAVRPDTGQLLVFRGGNLQDGTGKIRRSC